MIHHVGVLTTLEESVKILDVMYPITPLRYSDKFKFIPEWECTCHLFYTGGATLFEVVIPNGGKLLEWHKERGPSLHHMALRVKDIRETCNYLRLQGVPLVSEEPVLGIDDWLVNFVHPSHCGVLLELVEETK